MEFKKIFRKENINKKTESEMVEREYFFPAHGLNVKAVSIEEANKKVDELLKKKNPSIENLKNYKNDTLNIDIFSAISHGQNRGVLKKGKIDDREKLINDLYQSIPEVKFALFGMKGLLFFFTTWPKSSTSIT